MQATVCVAILALGELGASKILETPGSITFAHEVFTLMHYGLSNDLAAHCLLLLAAVSLGNFALEAWLRHGRSSMGRSTALPVEALRATASVNSI